MTKQYDGLRQLLLALGLCGLLAGGAAAAGPVPAESPMAVRETAVVRALAGFEAALKALQQEERDVQAGRLSERDSDERSRSLHAPRFRQLLRDFDQVQLPPDDPRQPLLRETRRMSELLLELLEMPSRPAPGSGRPQPADPARYQAVARELQTVSRRIEQLKPQLKAAGY